MYHVLIIPKLPLSAVVDPETERLEKLLTYHRHHRIFTRYKLTFKAFIEKVDSGSWDPYLAK